MRALNFLLILPVISLLGCAGTDVTYTPLGNPNVQVSYQPISPSQVQIFIMQKPSKPYVEMGVLSAYSWFSPSDKAQLFEAFRQKAAQIGANGVIMMPESSTTFTLPEVTYDYYGRPIFYDTYKQSYNFTATAIKIL